MGPKTTQSVQRWTPYILWGGWGLTMSSHNDHLNLLSPSPFARGATCIRCDPPFSHALGMALSDPGNHESAFATRTPCRSSRGRWPALRRIRVPGHEDPRAPSTDGPRRVCDDVSHDVPARYGAGRPSPTDGPGGDRSAVQRQRDAHDHADARRPTRASPRRPLSRQSPRR